MRLLLAVILIVGCGGKKDDCDENPGRCNDYTPRPPVECVNKPSSPECAAAKAKLAEEEARKAREETEQARLLAMTAAATLAEVNVKIDVATTVVANATTDADRQAGTAALAELKKQLADAQAQVVAAKAAAARAKQRQRVHISQECLDNPLAKGCR